MFRSGLNQSFERITSQDYRIDVSRETLSDIRTAVHAGTSRNQSMTIENISSIRTIFS
ncbi:hypothetical protein [Leptospira barantonii]|uniref:hypothetical protein n=1 Tax=Leptospira barantonii TaxID=2023184 RepID=UPI0013FE3E69|nr:hypothetical protein [Leptospira barantonii]